MKEKFKFQNIVVVTFVLLLAFAIAFACVFSHIGGVCNAATDFKTVGKSAYMVDYATGTVLYARGENERLPIASMVKIMTSLLTLECVDSGKISLDDDVVVSQNAASMGGSQVFLDANSTHKVGDLLKTVIVASANDSCVALAEHISGSVETFVARMNERAEQLGMKTPFSKTVRDCLPPRVFQARKTCRLCSRSLLSILRTLTIQRCGLKTTSTRTGAQRP